MVYGQHERAAGNRLRVALTGLTMAEYFRDESTTVVVHTEVAHHPAGWRTTSGMGRLK